MTSTDPPPRVVALTGANGYVGGLLSARFRAGGWTVIPLQRTVRSDPDSPHARRFVLGEPVDPAMLAGVDLLVHCAYDRTLTKPSDVERVNVEGTRRLFEAVAAQGVARVVLISSMSAYWGTEQIYGRAKLECESAVAAVGGVAVRLGLVYGEGWGGMAGSLRKLVQLPVTPLVGFRSYQFTVHEADVAEGVFAVGSTRAVPAGAVVGLAHPQRVPFRSLLEAFGRQAGTKSRFLPVPWQPVYGAMRVAEKLRVPLPLGSDSLLGLVRPAGFVPLPDTWSDLGVTVRPFTL